MLPTSIDQNTRLDLTSTIENVHSFDVNKNKSLKFYQKPIVEADHKKLGLTLPNQLSSLVVVLSPIYIYYNYYLFNMNR